MHEVRVRNSRLLTALLQREIATHTELKWGLSATDTGSSMRDCNVDGLEIRNFALLTSVLQCKTSMQLNRR